VISTECCDIVDTSLIRLWIGRSSAAQRKGESEKAKATEKLSETKRRTSSDNELNSDDTTHKTRKKPTPESRSC